MRPFEQEQLLVNQEKLYAAPNYAPLDVVFVRGEGVWLYDIYGNTYLDMLSSYSAVSQGHCHPRLLKALNDQAQKLTLTSRVFHSETLGPLVEKLHNISGFDKALIMNTGAEAVETGFKAARKWGHKVKGIPENKAEIIVCDHNFHGRTMTAVSMSTEPQYIDGFGPMLPNIIKIPYNDVIALGLAINENTAAFIVEPIQGEGGIIVPDADYLETCYSICKHNNVLLICDEVQTGLGRTGKMFAFEHSGIQPDGIMIGKALSGGILPVSAFLANDEVMNVFKPGDHGSTFGASALACAVAHEALNIILDEYMVQNCEVMGEYFMSQLQKFRNHPLVKDIRGKGLLIGIELDTTKVDARVACETLLSNGVVSKDTHGKVLRFAPPLSITVPQILVAVEAIEKTLDQLGGSL